jgi:hypothetical protein
MEVPEQPANDQASTQDAEFARLRSNWRVLRPQELRKECERAGQRYLIDGLIPERSLGLLVGDSGLGKSPLAYQMGICVATGIPFLGLPTQKSRVLYLDFENGLQDVNGIITQLSTYLGLNEPPGDLFLWNINDCLPNWGQNGHTAFDLIRDLKPGLVFIDPISALYPKAEKNNDDATQVYLEFRKVIRDCGGSIVNLHHRKKPASPRPGENVVLQSLEDDLHARQWFAQARGAGVLVNGADIRLGVDIPGMSGVANGEIALVVRGYGRVRGEIPTLHLARVFDDDGEALGYRKVAGSTLLCNPDQERAFAALPEQFTTKQAMQAYGRQDEATSEFLKKCISKGILRKVARGLYGKVKVAE